MKVHSYVKDKMLGYLKTMSHEEIISKAANPEFAAHCIDYVVEDTLWFEVSIGEWLTPQTFSSKEDEDIKTKQWIDNQLMLSSEIPDK